VDGYELQFGINFLGLFALTGRLYPLLERTAGARVVTVSSGAAMRVDRVDFGDLKLEKDYDPNRAYAVSKLAGLLFAFEFQRRLEDAGANVISVAAHPGVVRTDLGRHIPKENLEAAFSRFKEVMQPWQGALPSLYAATDINVKGGDYYGPDGENEHAGYPALSSLVSAAALDQVQANRLWVYAEGATGVSFP
jgi:NAD(P)-dependent dehydrogenase (short-subunit alcohol dehydrogenase family)